MKNVKLVTDILLEGIRKNSKPDQHTRVSVALTAGKGVTVEGAPGLTAQGGRRSALPLMWAFFC